MVCSLHTQNSLKLISQEKFYSILGLESQEAVKHSFPQSKICRFCLLFCLVVSLFSPELLNDNQQHTVCFPCVCPLF